MKTLTLTATAQELNDLRRGLNALALHAWWATGGNPLGTHEVQTIIALDKILTAFGHPPTKVAKKRLAYALDYAEHYEKTYK